MSVLYKVYLLKRNGDEADPIEIRRIPIDEGVATNFEYVREKMVKSFPHLNDQEDPYPITFIWKDSNGDNITFSSDEELIDALTNQEDKNKIKIYIKQGRNTQDKRENPFNPFGPGFMFAVLNSLDEDMNQFSGPGCSGASTSGCCWKRRKTNCGGATKCC